MSRQTNLQSFIEAGVLGSISSGLSTFALYPLDFLKTSLQLSQVGKKSLPDSSLFSEAVSLAKTTFEKDGISGFYVGLTPNVVYIMTSWGTFFALNDYFAEKFKDMKYGNILANIIAGMINVVLTNPLSVISTFVIAQKRSKHPENLSLLSAAKKIYERDGLHGFYKGLGVSLVLVINPVINFALMRFLTKVIKRYTKRDHLRNRENFAVASISKLLATLATYPYTTIKVNQQGKHKEKKIIELVFIIYIMHGFKGLYSGIGPKLLHTVLQFGVLHLLNEKMKKMIR